ncbi:enoyl-CoA hydratase/isomerase family protein [Phytoactinopolyspora halotolerans]|uniref:Enoyl-CoA hydratase n=1 Tax=Phytoactinopolyspora halotolerans TaxID=1981512 RepID=A0A6L9S9E3_9ACTN|nr:enoyl-CoA hydratase-related protein [Phytoactinopolyspora halotolerans]NEE01244.1 enoyl-CoA hydratase [Phytoactinopolyspora halotolerans]
MVNGSADESVLLTRDGAVATVTLNRPDRGNGLTNRMKDALREALQETAEDAAIRAVVLTGAGRSFCVGQDLVEHAEALEHDLSTALATVERHYNPIVTSLTTMAKPVIAAINGACVGAGLGFALACDVRIASDAAKFGTAFTGIGLTCDSGLSATLARAVGTARASELIMLNETFTAAEAHEWGLVGRVVPSDELTHATTELATRLAAGPTLAYAEAKRAITGAWPAPLGDVLKAEAAAQNRLGLTRDHRNAVQAFLAKEKPTFTGE